MAAQLRRNQPVHHCPDPSLVDHRMSVLWRQPIENLGKGERERWVRIRGGAARGERAKFITGHHIPLSSEDELYH